MLSSLLCSSVFLFASIDGHVASASQSIPQTIANTPKFNGYKLATITSFEMPSSLPQTSHFGQCMNENDIEPRDAHKSEWICGFDVRNHEPFGCVTDEVCAQPIGPGVYSSIACCTRTAADLNYLDCKPWAVGEGTHCRNFGDTTMKTVGTETVTETNDYGLCQSADPSCGFFSIRGLHPQFTCGTTAFSVVLESRTGIPTVRAATTTRAYTSQYPDTTDQLTIVRLGLTIETPMSIKSKGQSLRVSRPTQGYILLTIVVASIIGYSQI